MMKGQCRRRTSRRLMLCGAPERPRRRTAAALSMAAVLALSAVPSARGADGTWNGTAADNQWATSGNWGNNVIPGNNSGAAGTSTDTAFFFSDPTAEPPALINVDLNRNVHSINFNSTTLDFRIGESTDNTGNTLYLSGGGTVSPTGNTAGAGASITAPVQFTGSTYTFLSNQTATEGVTFRGNVTAAPGGTTLTLDGTHGSQASSQAEINGALLDNPGGGVLSIVKNGSGTWEFNADASRPNTYSGDTIINGGIIRASTGSGFNGQGAFSPNSHYIVNNGGTLRNSVSGNTIKKLTVNYGGLVTVSTAAATLLNVKSESGPAITLNYDANGGNTAPISVNAPFGLTGTTADEGGLHVLMSSGASGTGAVTIASSSGYFDTGTVRRFLEIGKGNDVNTDYDVRIQGEIRGSGGIVKTGPGKLRFSGHSLGNLSPMTGTIEVREGIFNPAVSNIFSNQPPLLVSGGTLHLQSDHSQTFGAVTVTNGEMTGGNNNVSVSAPSFAFDVAGSDTARIDVILADSAAAGTPATVSKSGTGSATIEIAPTYTGATSVSGGVLAVATSMNSSPSISVSGGTFEVRVSNSDPTRAVKTGPISITGPGRIDLTQHRLITSTAAGTAVGGVYSGVLGKVQSAYNGGAWDQPGLTTSRPDAATGLTAIGVGSAAKVLNLGPGQTGVFSGQTVSDTDTIAMYTYRGDANMDGFISGDDYSAIDFASGTPGASGWVNGDFNYDGIISGDDYSAIDFNLVAQGDPFIINEPPPAGVTAVPEPAGVGGLAMLAAGLIARRRVRRGTSRPDRSCASVSPVA